MVYAVSEIVFPLLRPSISKQLVILQHCPFIKWLFWENCIWESFLYCIICKVIFPLLIPSPVPLLSQAFPIPESSYLSAAAAQQTAHCWLKLFTVHWTHLLIILIQHKVLFCPSSLPCFLRFLHFCKPNSAEALALFLKNLLAFFGPKTYDLLPRQGLISWSLDLLISWSLDLLISWSLDLLIFRVMSFSFISLSVDRKSVV
mgnify:CR=1 FL=1